MGKRDYFSMIDKINDSFRDNGWADGYANVDSDYEEIINQLKDRVSSDILIESVNLYLQGYEIGTFMSEEAEFIYDEDGNFKEDDYDFGGLNCYEEARMLVLCRKNYSDIK